ncbi:MAG: glycoside hydrolase family 15 protein [Candidatus Tectimicrobiota bacterium]
MARDIPIGNGTLLVTFDADYCIRDIYFPYVGQENHTAGHPCRFGVFVEGHFSWIGPAWQPTLDYDADTLMTRVRLQHAELALELTCRDVVDFHENVLLREVHIRNLAERPRLLKVFFSHDLHIGENELGNTAFYDPQLKALIHYRGPRYFLINVHVGERHGIDEWACGTKEYGGLEGTWRDAEDGRLEGNAIAQGSVDSTIAVAVSVAAQQTTGLVYWLAVGTRYREVAAIDAVVRDKGPAELFDRTAAYWRAWLAQGHRAMPDLPAPMRRLYTRSLLVMRTQIDHDGAVIASTDSDILQFGRDTYSYMWPRDGALTAVALDLAGYGELSRRFFDFCGRVISERGYFFHKYNPDGSLGSSWHPWYGDGQMQLPIQEDETALVLWALWRHYQRWGDVESLKPLYRPLIVAAAEFLEDYRDSRTGLPLPSYDLWEERRGISTFTAGAVYGGLSAAANFAELFGQKARAVRYRQAAEAVRVGMASTLFVPEAGRFARLLTETGVDLTVDASLYGAFAFGAFTAHDPMVRSSMAAVRQQLWVPTPIGGCARYPGDTYQRVQGEVPIPGNPWVICTLWLAQYAIEAATTVNELEQACEYLAWVAVHAQPSGVLPEQVHPYNGMAWSVAPLTWSHAEFVWTVGRFVERLAALRETGGAIISTSTRQWGQTWWKS